MKTRIIGLIALLCTACLLLAGCGGDSGKPAETQAPKDQGEPFADVTDDKDFSSLRTPGSQESAYDYRAFFRPAVDGIKIGRAHV